ncbi:MAG: glycosyltransferase [bacterium]
MRILSFRSRFSSLSETFIYDQIRELRRQGHDVPVVTLTRAHEENRPLSDIHVVRTRHRLAPRWVLRRLGAAAGRLSPDEVLLPWYTAGFSRVIRALDPDVVHAHFGTDGIMIAEAALACDVPLAVTFYGYDASRLPQLAEWRRRYELLFDQARWLIGISDHMCGRLTGLGAPAGKVYRVRLGVSADRFAFTDPRQRFDGTTVRCLHVGRLTEKKGPVLLVRAFERARRLCSEEVDLRLLILGDGPLRTEVEAEIERAHLGGSIELGGAVSHQEVRAKMAESHLYTQHSLTSPDGDEEGLGVSFVEASASGLPVVATRHDGIPEVVRDGVSGLLVREGDWEAMGDRIAELAVHPERWTSMGRAGRHHVVEHFSLGEQACRLVRVLSGTGSDDSPPT